MRHCSSSKVYEKKEKEVEAKYSVKTSVELLVMGKISHNCYGRTQMINIIERKILNMMYATFRFRVLGFKVVFLSKSSQHFNGNVLLFSSPYTAL